MMLHGSTQLAAMPAPKNYRGRGLFGRRAFGVSAPQANDGEVAPIAPSGLFGKPPLSGRGFGATAAELPGTTPPFNPDPRRQPQGTSALGGSMREPFDYDAALKALQGDQKKPKWWQYAMATVGDALAMSGGNQPWAVQNLAGRRDAQTARLQEAAAQLAKWKYQDYSRQSEADLKAANPFTIGRDRVAFDPSTGQAEVLYDGEEDFELYAGALGLEPGSQEYFEAVEDYVLRGSGPSAHGRDLELDDYRTDNDLELEGVRYGNRRGLEELRQRNRRELEGTRQGNRMALRQTPPARRSSGSPGKAPVSVKSPEEAQQLPAGTRYRTPDGQVFVR